jgi:cobyrinic acid a,c-diamide synthase
MAGLLPLETSFASRRLTLGYRAVLLNEIGVLGLAGAAFRGHEFHYATIITEDRDRPLFATRDARGRDIGPVGSIRGSVQGSFVHLIDAAE